MPAKQFQPRPPIPGVTEKRPQVSSAALCKPGPPSAFPLTSKCGPPAEGRFAGDEAGVKTVYSLQFKAKDQGSRGHPARRDFAVKISLDIACRVVYTTRYGWHSGCRRA